MGQPEDDAVAISFDAMAGCRITPASRSAKRMLLELLDGQSVVDVDHGQIGVIEGAA